MNLAPLPGIRIREGGRHIAIWCAGCRAIHGWIPINGGDPQHRWVWTERTLTLTPSVRHFHHAQKDGEEVKPVRIVTDCHYNVTAGMIDYHGDSTAHKLRGKRHMHEGPPPEYGGRASFGF